MTHAIPVHDYIRSDPFEVATCWQHGLTEPTALPATSRTPREALEAAILPALVEGPCYVTFSGGRDSSAVLAVATDLARRKGLPDPVPVTRVYPDLPESDETEWQELVVSHLRIENWLRLEFTEDETDLIGPAARLSIRQHGILWPPALHSHGLVYRHLSGGAMLTGEGGDAVLDARRITPLTLLRRRRRATRRLWSDAAKALAPAPVRRRQIARDLEVSDPQLWLRPDVARRHERLAAADEAKQPLRYDNATWWINSRRFWATMTTNQSLIASTYGVRTADPLLDAGFLAALAHAGGIWGFNGRTSTMKALFSDLLPPALLARRTKASFNNAYSGRYTREFATAWDGTGVDTELVDPEALRAMWLSDTPTMSTAMLLHQAWLASQSES
ncbi:asparagine synthase C-terminal domain-containing protein [Occultella kanbiaonis]|uniref:asparagine synthase C-terminal domain-containing protein n=1 Tax=Occultella kanbiaonis TaxID=2675754 RepID=UPI0012B741AA|nr:asparagine synthase C-terminal domain-containing protein [Occultella kanbiaonis]